MVKHRLRAEILLGQLSPEITQRGHVQRLPDLRTYLDRRDGPC